jgi:hypothetical protein
MELLVGVVGTVPACDPSICRYRRKEHPKEIRSMSPGMSGRKAWLLLKPGNG